MREIKFRAFLRSDQRLPNGITLGYEKYPRGIYEVMDINFASEIVTLWSEKEQTSFEVSFRKVELLQYTGHKDKNGKEIYDGYIVKGNFIKDNSEVIGKVAYFDKDTAFICHLLGGDYAILVSLEHLEVIGNIYENPELLQ